MTLELTRLTKHFGSLCAVDGVEFTVQEGAVFGFLGSNGAGKTTTLRMILRILLPDAGEVCWRGRPVTNTICQTFGYLPEERGLYPKMKVMDQLSYLAELRGLSRYDAIRNVSEWLDRLEIAEYRDKRVEQLSKGNQQKVQFIAAVAHRPAMVILDEPFSGLDPLNAHVLQDALGRLRSEGTTLLFSSHRLDQVEQLCTDVALIHRSRLVISGPLRDIKRQTGRQVVRLTVDGSLSFLDQFKGVALLNRTADSAELEIAAGMDHQHLLATAMAAGTVRRFELAEPSLEHIYLEYVGGKKRETESASGVA